MIAHRFDHRWAHAAHREHLIAVLCSVCLVGCSMLLPSRKIPEPEALPFRGTMLFSNSSDDAVRVFLVENDVEWLVGHVQPGETAHLTLPAGVVDRTASDVYVAVVPVGAGNFWGGRASRAPGAIVSMSEPSQNLVAMHWTLAGSSLFSLPLRR
jgi:hypothetical protein